MFKVENWPPGIKKAAVIIITTILVSAAVAGMVIVSVYLGAFGHLQSKQELLRILRMQQPQLYYLMRVNLLDSSFLKTGQIFLTAKSHSHLLNALIATEDARFFEHEGIDSRSLLRVMLKTILINDRQFRRWKYYHTAAGKKHVRQEIITAR